MKNCKKIVYRKVAARMTLMDLKQTEVARMLGISYSSLHNKLCGVSDFSFAEVLRLKQILCITGPVEEAFERYEGA